VFEDIPDLKLPDQMVGLAEDIIDKMTGELEPEQCEGWQTRTGSGILTRSPWRMR
jgi:non-homologous end joining protein Ku